ncbi:DUF3592 domain-containing protein [Bradyrhizobium sp. WD16]|uniref:DUF3592 domain-containing protein n=1 Tax=Bradyrhizobium sp. WD16 TaxID=1521768 RepID=UPI0020A2C2A3|nr:DUF3592 domain-containing protein [Bradyrhizobium sp. WD16]UTD27134.1 DUF3592 domain-containing protein [Bradyrhizobium sp. WD16]
MLDASQLLWTRVGAAVCLLLAAGFLHNFLRRRGTAQAAKGWSRVEGEIIASGVDLPSTHTSDDATDDAAAAVIRYRYHASGTLHECDRIGFGGPALTTPMLAAKHAARYPIGAKVDVYVDPRDPARAVLEAGHGGNVAALAVFALSFAAIAAILVAHAIAGHVLYTAKGVPLFAFGLPLACLAVASASVVSFFGDRRRSRASAAWPNVPGRITRCAVVEEDIEERPDDGEQAAAPRRVRRYHVDLRYAYHVGGRDLTGTAIGFGWTPVFGRRADAEAAAARYQEGQLVSVHYDPAEPSAAVLEAGGSQAALAPLVFALIFAAGGAGMLAFFVKVGFTS